MNLQRRDFLLVATLAVATVTPVSAQTVAPTVGPGGKQGAASVPDFSGVWTHSIPGFEPLASVRLRWSTGRAARTVPATSCSLSAITPIRSSSRGRQNWSRSTAKWS